MALSLAPGNREWMQKSDMLMGIGVVAVVAMLIIPLPTFLLDFLMAVSIMTGLLVIMIVMFINRPFEFSVFPSLLLITTVFRLALNVSSTRLILLDGSSFDGKIIRTFGNFVVGGNYVVGFIVFIILIIVQAIVITKGATRISEVSARFTLDAMPGKQMSIDADVASGIITEEEAKVRREEIRQEADFYGAMDGASKFVQGDVKVSIAITLINLVGGFIIGMVQRGETLDLALKTYSLLSIGDGLVGQIPSLMITTATGIIVTRASAKDGDLGKDLGSQLGQQPRALYITAGALGAAVLIPGFPKLALILLSSMLAGLGYLLTQSELEAQEQLEADAKEAASKDSRPEDFLAYINVDPLAVEMGYNLIPLVDPEQGGTLLERITNIRRRSAMDMGLIVPPIRIRDNMDLEPETYSILIKGVEVGRGVLEVGKLMAMDSGSVEEKIEGPEFIEPVLNLKALWLDADQRDLAESRGYMVVDCPTIVATHLTELIKRHADEILGREEVKQLVEHVQKSFPAIVEEINEKKIQIGEIQRVLQNLLRERVSIRNMATILETFASYGEQIQDPGVLTEFVRQALGRQITSRLIGEDGALSVITVDPQIENVILNSIREDPVEGRVVNLDPDTHGIIVKELIDASMKVSKMGHSPIFLVSPQIRSVLFAMLERETQSPTVLAYNEVGDSQVNVLASAMVKQ